MKLFVVLFFALAALVAINSANPIEETLDNELEVAAMDTDLEATPQERLFFGDDSSSSSSSSEEHKKHKKGHKKNKKGNKMGHKGHKGHHQKGQRIPRPTEPCQQ